MWILNHFFWQMYEFLHFIKYNDMNEIQFRFYSFSDEIIKFLQIVFKHSIDKQNMDSVDRKKYRK